MGDAADVVVRATRGALAHVLRADSSVAQALSTSSIELQGDEHLWKQFLACLDTFEPGFSIVTP